MNRRKGQAAMEFLMTYGWAILAAIIAIGVLAYFGVFNPQQIAGSTGVVRAPFNLDAYNVIDTGDVVNLEITQNSGQSLNVTGITITGTGPSTGLTCNPAAGDLDADWVSGTRQTVAVPCSGGTFAAGDAFAGDIAITYLESGSALTQTTTGSIRDTVQ